MRISDWSSDVCSSDLCGRAEEIDLRPGACDRTHRLERSSLHRGGSALARAGQSCPCHSAARCRCGDCSGACRRGGERCRGRRQWLTVRKVPPTPLVASRLNGCSPVWTKAGVFGWRPAPAPARPIHRSEEHTSELQSLMRTSYAVFCLNKT